MVVSDHHTASPQESRVLVGRPRSRNHNPVPPATTTTADTTVTAAARRRTALHVTLDRGADMPPSSAPCRRSDSSGPAAPDHRGTVTAPAAGPPEPLVGHGRHVVVS